MTENVEIEFTDRYDGRKVPWNYCRGACEAMGVIPVQVPVRFGFDPAAGDEAGLAETVAICADGHLLDLARADHERGVGHEDGHCDGWHFVRCPDCGGTGEIGKLRALRYLPGKAWRTLRFVWDHGVRGYSRPSWWSRRQQLRAVLRIAVGLDPH